MNNQIIILVMICWCVSLALMGCLPETTAKLDQLPEGVEFKGKLEKVRYDLTKKTLIVKGDLVNDEYNELIGLSGDFNYRKAIDHLFEWTNKSETVSSGHLRAAVDPALFPLMRQMKQNFLSGKSSATIDLYPENSQKAIESVLNEESRFALIMRGLSKAELDQAVKISAQVSRFGRDAICVVVHPKNQLYELRVSQLGDILSGKITRWEDVNGAKMNIRLLLPHEEDGRRNYLEDTLGITLSKNAESTVTESQVLEMVLKDSSAIGIVGMASAKPYLHTEEKLRDTTKFKVLALRANLQNASDVLPYQAYVAQSKYPLTIDIYSLFRTNLGNFPTGFSTFLHSGQKDEDGQSVLIALGLVPTRVKLQLNQ